MWYHLSLFYPSETGDPALTGLGAAYARVASCTALAQVLGAPLAAGILAMDGLAGLRGWQWLFLLEGLATIAFGAVLRLALVPSPAKARMLTPAERSWLQQRQARAAARQQEGKAAGGGGAAHEGLAGILRSLKATLGAQRGSARGWDTRRGQSALP